MGDKVLFVSPPMTNGEIRDFFLNLAQAITLHVNVVASQLQAMTAQAYREVGHHMTQHAIIMASRLRYFTRINPLIFYRSRADEDPQDFLYELHDILFAMGVTTGQKIKLDAYQLKDVEQTSHTQWRDNSVTTLK